jgi:hypothetical protein
MKNENNCAPPELEFTNSFEIHLKSKGSGIPEFHLDLKHIKGLI